MDGITVPVESGYFKNTPHYNTEDWCASALHFKEFGKYTNYPPNDHPSSRYYKFWEEEARRSVYGYDIGRDKIPGYFYWYLNYSPIYVAIELPTDKDLDKDELERLYEQAQADRQFKLPDFWDGDYQYYWYLDDAEKAGEHGVIIKTRGRGYSFKGGGMCNRNYYLIPGSKSFVFADDKAYLIEDGLLSKCWEMMDHIEQHTPWGKRRQKADTMMHKRASYIINSGGLKIEKGFKSEIMGISLKNNWNKARGKRGKLILYEECHAKGTKIFMYDGSFKNIEDIKIGDKVMGIDSKPRDVLKTITGNGKMYIIKQSKGIDYKVTENHLLYTCIRKHSSSYIGYRDEYRLITPKQLFNSNNYIKAQIRGVKSGVINFDEKELKIDPYFMGLWLGDGSARQVNITTMDDEIRNYLYKLAYDNNLNIRVESKIGNKAQTYCISNGRNWSGNNLLKALQYYNVHNNKQIHDDFIFNSKENRLKLLAGLIDSDGSLCNKKHTYVIATKDKDIADKILYLARTLGYRTQLNKNYRNRNDKIFLCYRVHISGNTLSEIPVLIERKKANKWDSNYNALFNRIEIVPCEEEEYFGITLDNDNLYMLEDLTITHNSGKNPNLLKAWNVSLKSMQQGRLTFGLQVGFGTGGTEDEDFIGLEQLFYEGGAYNIHLVPNIWDEGAQNNKSGHFISVEQNLEGAMDKDGNSLNDIARQLTDHSRAKVTSSTKNPETITRFIAEEPRTPQEASMRLGGTIFPVKDLKAHLNHIRAHPDKFENQEYLGTLEINEDSQKIEWKPDDTVRPIRKFPELDKKNIEGAIVIYEHPVMIDGVIPWGVYLAGNDTYDHDESTTDSLGSTFIMNKLTERIVAEYTGRPATANGYYENVRRLLIYYRAICNYENNWKGLFTYLNNRHSSHLLCDTPKIIADKIFDKSLLNRGKGTPGTEPIQKWGREQILIWLTTPIEPGSEILNLHRIRSIPLLQELIYWNSKGNFDRVDSIQMLMILKEDMQNIMVEDPNKRPLDDISPFFRRQQMFQEKLRERNDPILNHLGKKLQLLNRNKS